MKSVLQRQTYWSESFLSVIYTINTSQMNKTVSYILPSWCVWASSLYTIIPKYAVQVVINIYVLDLKHESMWLPLLNGYNFKQICISVSQLTLFVQEIGAWPKSHKLWFSRFPMARTRDLPWNDLSTLLPSFDITSLFHEPVRFHFCIAQYGHCLEWPNWVMQKWNFAGSWTNNVAVHRG